MAALQKELEQLRADNAHMEGQFKAAQAAQAKAGTLQQELQDLNGVTEQEGLVMQDESSSLKRQLEVALADYTAQMASASADSAKENNKLREQLDLALAESKSLRQQEERAFTAGHATMASESDEQVVALKQQIQQLQGKWRKEQQNVEQLWSKHSQAPAGHRQVQQAVADVEQRYQGRLTALARQLAAADMQAQEQERLHIAAVKHAEALGQTLTVTQAALAGARDLVARAYADGSKVKAQHADMAKWRALREQDQTDDVLKCEAAKAVHEARQLEPADRKAFVHDCYRKFHPDKNPWLAKSTAEIFKALQTAGLET